MSGPMLTELERLYNENDRLRTEYTVANEKWLDALNECAKLRAQVAELRELVATLMQHVPIGDLNTRKRVHAILAKTEDK